jgi:hypothetical protein
MARYTSVLTVAADTDGLEQMLREILESCNFNIVYESGDYLMARENPGQVGFSRLVTAEVLIDRTMATDQGLRMKCVVKNEELPLQVDNHCRKVFEQLSEAITQSQKLQLIQTVVG